MPVPFCLRSELDVFMDAIQVVREVSELPWTMWSDDELVILN